MQQKIKSNLDNYLGFDSNKLFESCDLMRIFGGAIRDSICGDPINDVDILVGSDSIHLLEGFLTSMSWKYMVDLQPKDLASVYNDIHVINEPHTWMKGDRIIQLIRPSIAMTRNLPKSISVDIYKTGFNNLISNVDISCCGVSWDGKVLYEDYKGAIVHCQSKVFAINRQAQMYSSKRIIHREDKFEKRGWKKIESNTQIDRDLKLELIC
jgi:hypothetical protein